MARYAVRRLLQAIPLLFGVVVILFTLLQLTPGSPIQALVGDYPVPHAYRVALVREFHLNQPVWEQFFSYLFNLLKGNLGYSFADHQSVAGVIFSRLPHTLLLAGVGVASAAVMGVGLGAVAAMSRRGKVDGAVNTFVLAAFSMPSFWLGQLLIIFFSVDLGWFPTQGMAPIQSNASGIVMVAQHVWYLVLPAIALCAGVLAAVTRVTRTSMLDAMSQDHVTTAELKGMSRWQILRHHVLRNAMIPVVTIVGYRFGIALAGTVLIETVFSWPGIGLLLIQSIDKRDNQVIMGIVLVVAVIVIITNFLTDLAYGALDPRVRNS